jgi:hypothetical protein
MGAAGLGWGMTVSSVRTKHWTRVEYERLIDLGAFRPGERLELVGGALLVRDPQGGPHATAVGLVEDALRQVFGAGWTVRTHSPIALDEDSEPEPDVAVVPGSRRDHSRSHPSQPGSVAWPKSRRGHCAGASSAPSRSCPPRSNSPVRNDRARLEDILEAIASIARSAHFSRLEVGACRRVR